MKALKWFVCIFIASVIRVVLEMGAKVSLGFFPTIMIYGPAFYIARRWADNTKETEPLPEENGKDMFSDLKEARREDRK